MGPDGGGSAAGEEEEEGEEVAEEVAETGAGRGSQKHKTPDNITHPFPDYPFEKLFCRWAAGARAGTWRCYPVEVFLHT